MTGARSSRVMGAVAAGVSRPVLVALAPVLSRQGSRVRRDMLLLPEAVGERHGVEGCGPRLTMTVIGDSTAAGVGVTSQRDGLARHTSLEVAQRCGRSVEWRLSARTGATARYTHRELVPTVGPGQDLTLVVLGGNDALRMDSRDAWRNRVGCIVDTLETMLNPGGRIVFAGVPDLGAFPALPQPLRGVLGFHARGLDHELRHLADRRPVVLHVPAPPLTGAHLFAEDGFHPNAGAYREWASQLAAAIAGAGI